MKRSPLPGFRLTIGFTLTWLGLLVLLPLAALVVRSSSQGLSGFVRQIGSPRAVAAIRFTFGASLAAAAIDALFGTVIAWVVARYTFPGKRLLDAVVDLPLALPTAIAGIALTAVWSKTGWLGGPLERIGARVAFTPAGVVVALAFVGLPFVVRTVQPIVERLDPAVEEASATLGATAWQTARRVLFPAIAPAVRAGFAAAFARALGEYGSVVFISGNMPMRTEIGALLVMTKLEQYDYAGAASIGVVLLAASLATLLVIHRFGAEARA